MSKPYLCHLKSAVDLKTTNEAVRAGFAALAVENHRRATPYVEQARALKHAASQAKHPIELLEISGIQSALVPVSSVNFVEELVFRFLLTHGDTLGGSKRNIGGFMAQKKLTRSIVAHLKLAGKTCKWLQAETDVWVDLPEDDADIELHLRGLCWESRGKPRTLVYNLTVPFFRNKVDLSLFNCNPEDLSKETRKSPVAYVALGELKGGIDPASADEHWKTARTALNRIHEAFAKQKFKPHTFFIGAAIEAKMATEIWGMLKRGNLENAANLTDEDQIASITSWLCSL
jgi:hypothetical protein